MQKLKTTTDQNMNKFVSDLVLWQSSRVSEILGSHMSRIQENRFDRIQGIQNQHNQHIGVEKLAVTEENLNESCHSLHEHLGLLPTDLAFSRGNSVGKSTESVFSNPLPSTTTPQISGHLLNDSPASLSKRVKEDLNGMSPENVSIANSNGNSENFYRSSKENNQILDDDIPSHLKRFSRKKRVIQSFLESKEASSYSLYIGCVFGCLLLIRFTVITIQYIFSPVSSSGLSVSCDDADSINL